MMVYNPMLAFIAISFCLVTVYISIKMNQQIKKIDKDIQNKISKLTERLSDILLGFSTLKMFRGSSLFWILFKVRNNQATNEEKQKSKKLAVLEMISFFLGILARFWDDWCRSIFSGTWKTGLWNCYGNCIIADGCSFHGAKVLVLYGLHFSSSLVKAGRVLTFLNWIVKN